MKMGGTGGHGRPHIASHSEKAFLPTAASLWSCRRVGPQLSWGGAVGLGSEQRETSMSCRLLLLFWIQCTF